jgi:two-component system sensor histidine kinase YesM
VISKEVGETIGIELHVSKGEKITNQAVVVAYQDTITDWKVMGIIPVSQLNQWETTLLLLTGLLTIIIVGLAIFTAIKTSNWVVKPITNLKLAMGLVEEGNLGVNINAGSYYEEINQLARSFNVMVNKVKVLMKDIYEDQQKLRKAELKALQSHINPHFLYNTLDSILWLNRTGNKEAVEVMIESLTTFFRVGISRGKDIITIDEEVKHLKSYLMIQNIRYGDKFHYNIDVDESALKVMVPKLILQPLVENAIYHGIKLKKETCEINVKIVLTKGIVKIEIKDTGMGMTEEKVNQLNTAMKGEIVSDLEYYGIKNIIERLKILFGDEAGMVYESKEGEGTKVTITLPNKLVTVILE